MAVDMSDTSTRNSSTAAAAPTGDLVRGARRMHLEGAEGGGIGRQAADAAEVHRASAGGVRTCAHG